MNLWRKLRDWWNPPVIVRVRRPIALKKSPRPWNGEGSLTADNILHHLQYGPLTRQQLDDLLDVTTAAIHLPKMIARGEVRKIPGTRPVKYELVQVKEEMLTP